LYMSLETGRVPKLPIIWCTARIQALQKPGKPASELGHLRPIALTSCVARLMERLV